jgi:hypothetical protein
MVTALCESEWLEDDPNVCVRNIYALLLTAMGKLEGKYAHVGFAKLKFGPRTSDVVNITII